MTTTQASLEALVETGILPCPFFHPGGTEVTKEMADMCKIGPESYVLDVACGNGATACFLAEKFGCCVAGIDATELQIERANKQNVERNLSLEFQLADAYDLPIPEDTYDAVISEAFLCHIDIVQSLTEMTRVAKPGDFVGTHNLCWQPDAPEEIKRRFAVVENERPETLDGWVDKFAQSGLVDIRRVDKTSELPRWNREYNRHLGAITQIEMFFAILRRWGLDGYRKIRESQRIWEGEHMGYAIIVGMKPKT